MPNAPKVLKRRQAIQSILDNPWFFRVWTIQEAGFARNCLVLCGKMQLSWRDFCAPIPLVTRALLNTKTGAVISLRLVIGLILKDPTPELWASLDLFWAKAVGHLNSSLPQDKVYGLYSIFKAIGLDLKNVDYDMTILEIYGDAMKSFSKRVPRSLSTLYLGIRPFEYDELPTWTPNWLTGHPHIPPEATRIDFTGYQYFTVCPFQASRNSAAAIPRPYPPNELQVRGIIMGKVSRIVISSSAAEPSEPARTKARISAFTRACRKYVLDIDLSRPGGPYKDPIGVQRALSFTLTFQLPEMHIHEKDDRRDPSDIQRRFLLWLSVLRYPNCGDLPTRDLEAVAGLEKNPNAVGEQECLEVIERGLDQDRIQASRERVSGDTLALLELAALYHHEICCQLANYAFLFLDTGHIGRAYFNSKENDRVALLAGSDVPFLLREVDDGQDRYRVVAPAYIHGVMDGELWPYNDEFGVKDMILV
jgi:hypothetical protein